MQLNYCSKIDCKGKAEGKNRRQECDIFLMYLIALKYEEFSKLLKQMGVLTWEEQGNVTVF